MKKKLLIEIPLYYYNSKDEKYIEVESSTLVNLSSIQLVEAMIQNGKIAYYRVYLNDKIYTTTNRKGYEIIKKYGENIEEEYNEKI